MNGELAEVGITDFAQNELGDLVFVDVNTVGKTLQVGEVFGTVEAVKTVSDLYMPVAGEIVEFNSVLASNAEIINKDPYGEGWIIRVRPIDFSDPNHLMDVASYRSLVGH